MYVIFHTVLYFPKCTLFSLLCSWYHDIITKTRSSCLPTHSLSMWLLLRWLLLLHSAVGAMDIGAVDHCCYNGTVSREPRKERLRAHSVKFLHCVLASVLAGTPPLAAFTRSGESTGLENRELLPLDSRRGECARVRHSLFGGGGAGPDSQSRSKSGFNGTLESTH